MNNKTMGKDIANPIQREQFIKDNADACENKNFTATVNNAIERSIKENGDRTDNFAQVVNSNLPESFTLSIPVFKGGDKENLEVETFAKIDGRNVAFVLMSPGAEETLETLRDAAIDKELEAIKEIAPEIAIIEI